MNEWGWNPASFQAIGSLITIGVLILALWTASQARRSANAAQASANVVAKESELRTRPWLSFTGCRWRNGVDTITMGFRNVGALPAQDVTSSVQVFRPDGLETASVKESDLGIVFPGGLANHNIYSDLFPEWMEQQLNVPFEGLVTYRFGDAWHVTRFKGTIRYQRPLWSAFEAT